jgi:succinoglycan biosynthesis transport protein ExoP
MNRSSEILLYNPPPAGAVPAMAGPEYVDFSSVMSLLWRRKRTIAICVGAGLALAAAFVFTQEKVYGARASIEIQVPNEDYLNRRQLNPVSELNSIMLEPFLQTQLRLIQSDTLLLKVAHQLDLASLPEYRPAPPLMTRVKGGFRHIARKPPTDLELLEMIRARLNLRLAGQTQILDITYESSDPALAARVANGIAEAYQTASLSATNGSASQTAALLSTQMASLKAALDQSEAQLRNFVDSNKLPGSANQESVAQLRLKQIQTDLGAAHDARVAAQSKYEMLSSAPPELLAQQLDSETLRAYRVKLTELRQQYAENIQIFTPEHYKIRQLQAEIDEVQQAFDRERAGILGRLRNEYRSAEFRENALAKDYEQQARMVASESGEAIRYETLKHEVDMNRQIYDATLQKLKEADLAAALEASNVRIVDRAVPAEQPSKPNKPLFAGIGLGAGFLFGMMLVFAQSRGPRPGPAVIQEPMLAATAPSWTSLPAEPAAQAEAEPSDPLENTRSWLMRRSENGCGQVVCVSSVSPRDGALETACALARQLAEAGRKTLLVDADGVSPTTQPSLRLGDVFGFFDLLKVQWWKDPALRENAIWMASSGGFFIMPAGAVTDHREAFAHRARVRMLFDSLRRDFDLVLVVMPPALADSEAQSLASFADGTVVASRGAAIASTARQIEAAIVTPADGKSGEPA